MNSKESRRASGSPLMELPPLSPGIQDRVIEVVVVLVTVRRGWSGGTEGHSKHDIMARAGEHQLACKCISACVYCTLNLQVEDNLLQSKTVTGCTCVVPRILSFHCADNKAAVTMDTAPRVNHNRSWCSVAETQCDNFRFRKQSM